MRFPAQRTQGGWRQYFSADALRGRPWGPILTLVLAALESLEPRDAEILRLRFLREQDYKAIAAKLDIPEASVGQTLYRAKRRLLDVLKSRPPG